MERIWTLFLLILALLIAGCTSGTSSNPSADKSGSGPPETTGSSAPAPHTVAIGDADKGLTVTAAVGDRVVLTLASTYWRFGNPTPPAILEPVGAPSLDASPPSAGRCVPGGGCGNVSITYRAAKPGTATASASRTSCGEARGCTGDTGSYQVTIVVR